MSRLVVFAWGNPSRGDDALGPLLAERLAALPAVREGRIALVEDFQLQVEHAMDLAGCALALFVDAASALETAFAFSELAPRLQPTHSTHAIAPESVLAVAAEVLGEAPPPAFLLAVGGESFELGAPLSARAAANLEAAWRYLGELLAAAEAAIWRERAIRAAAAPAAG
jgi:hydrogenase maturation protease